MTLLAIQSFVPAVEWEIGLVVVKATAAFDVLKP
jgi:hypothetical protein